MARTVREVMTRTVVAAPLQATYKDLVRMMHDHRVSAVPVIGETDTIVGIVSEADLLVKRDPGLFESHLLERPQRRHARAKALATVARDLMTAPAITIGPDAGVGEAAHLMREHTLKHVPVVDDRGHVLGIVSRIDLLVSFLRSDDAITDEVSGVIAKEVGDPTAVHVEAHDGLVSLEGLVEFHSFADDIADRIRFIDGVVSVDTARLDWEVDDTAEAASSASWVGF
jgi:CBS domain-containing protein